MQTQDNRPFFLRWISRLLFLIRAYFFTVGILTTVLFGSLFYMIAKGKSALHRTPLASDAKVVLHLKLEGALQEKSEDGGFWQDLISQATGKKSGPDLLSLCHQLDVASQDPRVVGLFIENEGLEGSYPALETLRGALSRFEATKKPVHIWSYHLDNKSLYLASVGTSLGMPPLGEARLGMPEFQPIYYGEALKKLGVDIEFVRVGKYKSAVEPLLSNTMSPEARQMFEKLEEEVRQQWRLAVGQGRHKSEGQLSEWVKQSMFTAKEALGQGMIDQVQYLQESKDAILAQTKGTVLEFDEYEIPHTTPLYGDVHDTREGIAYLEAVGDVRMGRGRGQEDAITPENMLEPLKWAREEKKIKAVLLHISSPGGDASAGDLIWQEVALLAKEKPVVVTMGALAASAGYYIASAAHHIIAHPATLTGSIGVFMVRPSFGALEEKFGVSFPSLGDATTASPWSVGHKLSPAAYQNLQRTVDATYATFLERVAQNRKWTTAQVHAVAQGYVWSGTGAKAIGLVDELGGFGEGVKRAQKLGGFLEDAHVPLYRWHPTYDSLQACLQKAPSLGDCFPLSKMQSQLRSEFASSSLLERMRSQIVEWKQHPLQMRMPFWMLPSL